MSNLTNISWRKLLTRKQISTLYLKITVTHDIAYCT